MRHLVQDGQADRHIRDNRILKFHLWFCWQVLVSMVIHGNHGSSKLDSDWSRKIIFTGLKISNWNTWKGQTLQPYCEKLLNIVISQCLNTFKYIYKYRSCCQETCDKVVNIDIAMSHSTLNILSCQTFLPPVCLSSWTTYNLVCYWPSAHPQWPAACIMLHASCLMLVQCLEILLRVFKCL